MKRITLCTSILIVMLVAVVAIYISQRIAPFSATAKRLSQYERYLRNLPVGYPENFLTSMQFLDDFYGVHCLIVGIDKGSYEEMKILAPQLFERWNVGAATGKGILILLNKKDKIVKIEVGFELEHIFTDAYCSYLEFDVFSPYVKKGDLAAAVRFTYYAIQHKLEEAISKNEIELLEHNRSLAKQGFLSGGAGVIRDISQTKYGDGIYLSEKEKQRFVAQPSPAETFELYKEVILRKIRNLDLNIYSEKTIVANKHWPGEYVRNAEKILQYPFFIKSRNATRAVILLKSETGTNRFGPYFLVKTSKGWQMDLPSIRLETKNNFLNQFYFEYSEGPYYKTLHNVPFHDEDIQYEENVEGWIATLKEDIMTNKNIKSCHALARIYYTSTLFDEAIEYYNWGLTIEPNDHTGLWKIAQIYDELNLYDTAITAYQRYARHYPLNKYYAYWRISLEYYRKRDYRNSIKYCKMLLKSPEQFFRNEGYNTLVYSYCDLNKIRDAEHYFNKIRPSTSMLQSQQMRKNYIDAAKARNR